MLVVFRDVEDCKTAGGVEPSVTVLAFFLGWFNSSI